MSQPLKTTARFLGLVAIVTALSLALTACNSAKRLTKANVDEVVEGMAKKQVESILGPPTTIDSKDFVVLKKTTYVYDQGKESVTIVFKDDKVQSKVSTLSE
jgi:outer membrane protein assembly factor BamE (lipoprotein component of BamABCDE complex)